MKRMFFFMVAALTVSPIYSRGEQSAQATIFCWSLRFGQGQGAFDETLDLSTVSGTPNGELSAWYSTYTHRSMFVLDYSGFPITGTLYVDLPPYQDANSNGFDDSFEVSQGISGNSSGEYVTAIGGGTVAASWSRSAGSRFGTCSLRLVDDNYGDLGAYRHTFEVLEYKGTLNYTPGSNTVSTSIILTNESGQIQGAADFAKSIADPYNALNLSSVAWTNNNDQVLSLYTAVSMARDTSLQTNYYGLVEFNDGDPATSSADYYEWELSIDDLNDTDGDGIPDFSDNPQTAVPVRPILALARGTTNLLLTISGDVGTDCDVQEAGSIPSINWSNVLSLKLTNEPQSVMLPLPAATTFWRILVK